MDLVGFGVVSLDKTEVAFDVFGRKVDIDDGFGFHFVEVCVLF